MGEGKCLACGWGARFEIVQKPTADPGGPRTTSALTWVTVHCSAGCHKPPTPDGYCITTRLADLALNPRAAEARERWLPIVQDVLRYSSKGTPERPLDLKDLAPPNAELP